MKLRRHEKLPPTSLLQDRKQVRNSLLIRLPVSAHIPPTFGSESVCSMLWWSLLHARVILVHFLHSFQNFFSKCLLRHCLQEDLFLHNDKNFMTCCFYLTKTLTYFHFSVRLLIKSQWYDISC